MARGISVCPEGRRLFPDLTVATNLELGLVANKDRSRLDAAYELLPKLSQLKDRKAGTLSGGEQQMVAIGRALASDPRVVVMDEVSLGLAPVVVDRLYEAILTIQSWGTAIVIGLGGYLTAILLTKTGLPLLVVVVLAAVAAALVGVVLAYPMIRLRGPYFAIGTLALTLAVVGCMLNWDLTNRSQAYPLPFADLLEVRSVYTLAVVVAVLTFGAVFAVMRSSLGLRVLALRDDEVGATSLGVRRTTTLLPVWAISALLTGLIGATYAVQKGTLDPQSAFSLQFTLDAIVVCVIGGLGPLTGPLVGVVVIYFLRDVLADYGAIATLLEALMVVLVVRFVPGGVVPVLGRLLGHRGRRPTARRGGSDVVEP